MLYDVIISYNRVTELRIVSVEQALITYQQMRDRPSEREPFYNDIAHVIQNTKKEFHLWDSNPRSLRYTRKACGRVLPYTTNCTLV